MFTLKEKENIKYLELTNFHNKGVKAYFTTRIGGVSSGSYASLNMGFHTGDDIQKVLQNRKKFCKLININYKNLIAGEQIHGDSIYVVSPVDKGKGAQSQQSCISGVDALITNHSGLPLISFYADCVPLYIFDPVSRAIGLAHAGWKGTLLQIGIKTLNKMEKVYGTSIQDCLIAIGPAITKDKYIVNNRVVKQYQNYFGDWSKSDLSKIITPILEDQYYLDLKLANCLLFMKRGVPGSQISISDYCTFKDSHLFYSYRRCNNTGRMISIIEI